MNELNNPFRHQPGYHCFGCSPDNMKGLRLKFFEDGDEILSHWDIDPDFQGYNNILHGGIQATLMDEIASWTVYVKVKTAGFTSKAEIRYLKTVSIDNGPLLLRSKLLRMRRNLADIEVSLWDRNGLRCAEGLFIYFTYPLEKSKATMFYPDPSGFSAKDNA